MGTAEDGAEAQVQLSSARFDVIVSDIGMPGMSGIELLRAVRGLDLDVPVILMTGDPGLRTAIQAVEFGAFKYLTKPVAKDDLLGVVERAAKLHRLALLKRESLAVLGQQTMQLGDRASEEVRFERALQCIWMAYQPIVSWRERRLFGYEALIRCEEPTLSRPDELLLVAERLGHLHDLGRVIRTSVSRQIERSDPGTTFFVNLHAADLEDEDLFAAAAPLSRMAGRVVLEITERASLERIKDVRGRIRLLRRLGFRIAVDDLGAGYAGLSSFTQIEPDVVKLDMSLVRDIDTQATKQRVVRAMAELCRGLGMIVVAEGVETPGERDTLDGLGCDLLQGYLFARPARDLPSPAY